MFQQLQFLTVELNGLRATVQQLSQEPAPTPAMPTMEELAAALVPRIMEALKPEIAEALEKQKAEVERVVRERAPDLSQLENSIKEVSKAPEVLAALESTGRMTNGVKGKENIPKP